MSFCMKCGSEIVDGSKFCMKCGAPVEMPPVVEEPAIEALVVEAPIEQPAVEEPVVEAPVVEQPVMEAPVMEQPVAPQPVYEQQIPPVASAIPTEPKKKSKAGLIAALVSIGVVAIVAIVLVIVLLVTGGNEEVDVSKFVSVEYEGYDTVGTADIEVDSQGLVFAILEAQGEDTSKVTVNSVSVAVQTLLGTMDFELSKESDLSNGEKVEVVLTYDKKMAEKCEIEFVNSTMSFTVKGLTELIEVDPFEDIEVTFNGNSGSAYAYYSNYSDISCVDWSYFTFDKSDGLSNGDVITLTISESDVENAVNSGYKFTVLEKQYTVENRPYYYGSLDEITDENMETIKADAVEVIENTYEWYDNIVSLENMEYVGSYFGKYNNNYDYYNHLVVVYKATFTSVEGTFASKEVYLPVKVTDLYVDENGEFDDIYSYMLGSGGITVEGSWYSYSGYETGLALYQTEIEANSGDYTFEASESVSGLENETGSQTVPGDDSTVGDEGLMEEETTTGDDTAIEGEIPSEEETPSEEEIVDDEGPLGMGG